MARDVLVASMNKGQFPLAMVGIIFMVMVLKMPSEDVSKLVFRIFDGISDGSVVGYVMSAALLMGWVLHSKWQRRIVAAEIERMGREKSQLQEKLLDKSLTSSEKGN